MTIGGVPPHGLLIRGGHYKAIQGEYGLKMQTLQCFPLMAAIYLEWGAISLNRCHFWWYTVTFTPGADSAGIYLYIIIFCLLVGICWSGRSPSDLAVFSAQVHANVSSFHGSLARQRGGVWIYPWVVFQIISH